MTLENAANVKNPVFISALLKVGATILLLPAFAAAAKEDGEEVCAFRVQTDMSTNRLLPSEKTAQAQLSDETICNAEFLSDKVSFQTSQGNALQYEGTLIRSKLSAHTPDGKKQECGLSVVFYQPDGKAVEIRAGNINDLPKCTFTNPHFSPNKTFSFTMAMRPLELEKKLGAISLETLTKNRTKGIEL